MKLHLAIEVGLAGALGLLATGAWLAWDPVGTDRQLLLSAHIGLGLLCAAPIGWAAVHHTRQRLAARPGSLDWAARATGGLLAGVLATGLLLLLPVVLGARIPGLAVAHRWTTVGLLALTATHLAKALARKGGARRRQRARMRNTTRPLVVTAALVLLAGLGAAQWLDGRPALAAVQTLPGAPDLGMPALDLQPAQTRTASGVALPVERLAQSEACGSCHADIAAQWSESMHRYSASDEHVATSIRWYQRDNGVEAGRLCAGCHNPIPLAAGLVSTESVGRFEGTAPHDEGVSCLSCHAVTDVHEDLLGNGAYTLTDPGALPTGTALGKALVLADLDAHKAAYRKPLHETSAFCGSCHQQFSPLVEGTPSEEELEQQYAEWRHSDFSDENHPKGASCQDCHMPLVESTDPAATDGKVRSHRFPGGNHAHAVKLGQTEQAAAVLAMLRGGIALEVVHADAAPGKLGLDVVVDAHGVGHRFPSGTTDISQAWIELVVGDPAAPLFASGLLDERNYLDPDAHTWRTLVVDDRNLAVDLHNLTEMKTVVEQRYIEPGGTERVHYEIDLAPGVSGDLPVRARLRYRRANQRWNDWLFNFDGRTTPITDIQTASLRVEAPAEAPLADAPPAQADRAPAPAPAGMVVVPAGPFLMGDRLAAEDEQPEHTVDLPVFAIDRVPVTNAAFAAFVSETQGASPVLKLPWAEPYNWSEGAPPDGSEAQPAILVTQDEARAYCQHVGKHLPTEQQWEKAARGTDGRRYPWGNGPRSCAATLGEDVPHGVGLCPELASPYGALDMVGGVVEWTASPYGAYPRDDLHPNENEWVVTFDPMMAAVRGAPPGRVGPGATATSRTGQNGMQRGRIGFRCAKEML